MAREKIVVDIEADVKSLLANLDLAKRKITDWKRSLNDANIKFDVNKPLKNLQNSLEKESVIATKGLNKQLSAVAKDIKIGVDTKQAKKDIAELEAALNRLKALSLAIKNAPFHVSTQKTAGNLAYGNNRASDARLLLSKLKDNGLDVDSAKKAVKNYENAVAKALKDSPSIANYQVRSGVLSKAIKDSFTMQKEAGLTPNLDKLKQKLAQVKVLEASMYDGLADNKNAQKSLTQAIGLLQELGDKAKAVHIDGFGNGLDSANAKMQQLKVKGQNVIDKINEPEISKAEQIRTSNNIARANNALDKEERRSRAEADKQVDAMWRQVRQEEIEQIRKDKEAEREREKTDRALTALENKERRERLAKEKNEQFNTRIKNATQGAEKAWREGDLGKYNALVADRDATIAAQNEFLNSLRSISEQQKVYRNLLSQIKNGTITEQDPRYDTAARLKNRIEERKNNFNTYAKQLLGDTGNSSAGVDKLTNSMKNNRREVNNDSKQFNELRKQLASTIAEINKFDTSADNGNKALNSRVQEALGIMNNMKQFLTERGKLSYAAESKLYGDFLPSIKNEYARREWLKRQRVAAVNNNYANLGSGLRSNVEGRYEPTISSLKNILSTRLSGVELAKLAGSFERGFGSGLHELARQSEMAEKSILGINSGLVAIPESISTGVAAFAVFSVAIGMAVSTIETLFSVVQSIGSAIEDYIIKPGLEAANAMQMMRNGIAGAMSSIGLLNNQPLQFSEALNMADGIVKQLAVDAIKTGTSLEAITNTFRAIIEPGLQAGMNISQIEEMANLFTTIGKELQLNSLTIARDTRDIFNGMANRTVMAKQLGITDQEIQEVKAKGEDLYAWLENRLAGFVASNRENIATLGGAFDSLKSTWELTLASVFDSDAVKHPIIEFMKWIGSQIATVYDMGINPNSAKWEALKKSSAARNGVDTSDQAAVDQNAEDTGLQDDATKYREATEATEEETKALEEQNATVIVLNDSFEALLEFVTNFVEIIGDAIIEVAEYAEQSLGAEDSVNSLSDAISICVDLLVFIAERIIDVIAYVEENKTSIEDLGYAALYAFAIIKNVLLGVLSYIKPVIAGFRALYNMARLAWAAMRGDKAGAVEALTQVGANLEEAAKGALKKYVPYVGQIATGVDIVTGIQSDLQTIDGWRKRGQQAKEAGENSQPHKNLHESIEGIKEFLANRNHILSTQNPNQNALKGRPADDSKEKAKAQREAAKARREAIKESQRMLKERQQALKEILDDKLQELKDALKKNEIAYKEGFKSIGEYFTQKAELEKQEAQARLEEAQQEREAIANSKFDSEYQKLAALHKVDREIRKYTRELGNATKAQQGVANILSQYKSIIEGSNLFGTLNRFNSGTQTNKNGGTQTNNKLLGVWKPKNDRSNETDSKLWDLAFKETEEAHKHGYVVNPGVFRGIHQMEAQENGVLTWLPRNYNNYWGLKYDANNASKYNMYDTGMAGDDGGTYAGFNNIDDGIRAFFDNYIAHKGTSYLEEIANASNDGYAVAQIMYNNGYFTGNPYTYGKVMSEYTDEYNSWGLPAVVDVFGNSLQANTQAVQSNTQVISAKKAQSIADLNSTIEYAITGTPEEVAKDITAPTVQMLNDADNWIRAHRGTTIWTSGNRTWGGHTTHTKADIQSGIFNNSSTRREFVKYMASIGWAANNEYDYPSSSATGPHMDLDSTGNKWVTADNISVDTSKTGMGSTTLNNLQQAQEDTTDLEQQMREAVNKFIEEYNSVVEEIRANIFGEMPDVTVKFKETFKKLRDAKNIAGTNKDALALVEKLKIQIRQQIAKTVTDFYMAMLETNLDRVQETGQEIANKFATGNIDTNQIKDFYKRYFGYFFGEGQNIDAMKKRLEELKSKQAEYEKKYMNEYFGVDARDEKALKDAGNSTRAQYLKAKEHQYSTLNEQLYKVNNNKDATEEEIKTANLMVKTARREVQGLYKLFDKEAHPYKDEIAKLEKSIELAMQTPLNQMISLEEQFAEMQRLGNVGEAQKIRRKLESARNTLYGIYDNWIKAIESKYDFESNYFEQMPVTNLQKEQGNQLLSAYKNKELAYANQQKLDLLNNQYMYRLEKISEYENEIKDLEKTNARGLHDNKWADRNAQIARLNDKIQGLKFATGELYKQIGDTTQIIRLEKELAKIPTLLQSIGKVAKQSLEDNLVTFLTDGVNEAKSFKEAFGNMLIGILKDIQTFLAKETARDLMTALFGHYHSEGIGNGDSKGNMYEKASAQAVKEIQTNDSHTRQQLETFANGEGILGSNLYTTYRYDVDKYKNAKAPKLQTPYFMSEQYKKSLNQPKYSFKLSDNPFTISGSTVSKTLDADTTKKVLYDTRDKSKQIEQSIDVDKLGVDTQAVLDRLNGINVTLQTIDSHITGKPISNVQEQQSVEKGTIDENKNSVSIESQDNQIQDSNAQANVQATQQVDQGVSNLSSTVSSGTQDLSIKLDGLNQKAELMNQSLEEIKLAASDNKAVDGHATGGFIRGAGTSTSDSIPAMLSNGEFVVKASAVRKYGTGFLNAVNNGNFTKLHMPVARFADGGEVAVQETARGMSTFASTLGTNISNTTNMNVALVSNQEEAIAHFMRSPRGQRIMLDFTRGSAKFTNKIVGSY